MPVSDVFRAVQVVRVLGPGRVMPVYIIMLSRTIFVLLRLLEQVPVPVSEVLLGSLLLAIQMMRIVSHVLMISGIVIDLVRLVVNIIMLFGTMILFNRVMIDTRVLVVVMIKLFINGAML